MRLKQFLQESITQFEFAGVLANKNLLAGCEFEFYLDKDNKVNVDEWWNLAIKESQRFNSNISKYHQEINELMEKSDSLYDEIGKLQSEYDDDNDPKIEQLSKQYSDIDDNIENLSAKYILTHKELPNYFKLAQYIDQNIGWPKSIGTRQAFDDMCVKWFEEDEHVQSPSEFYNENMKVKWQVASNENHLQTLKSLNFPLDFSNVTTDEKDTNHLIWKVIADESLETIPELGVEVVTPTMQISKLIDKIDEVFNWMKKNNCWTDNTCGFHVHVSLKPDKHSIIDPVKLMLFVEEGLVYKKFEERIGNGMAQSLKDVHLRNDCVFSQKTVMEVLKTNIHLMSLEKMSGVRFVDVDQNHVEYRYMGAKNYQNKFDFVKNNVVNYGHWMSLACDISYKRKDYVRKVANIVNKFNDIWLKLFVHFGQEYLTTTPHEQSTKDKINKILAIKRKKASQIKKLDKKLFKQMLDSYYFMNKIEEEWMKKLKG